MLELAMIAFVQSTAVAPETQVRSHGNGVNATCDAYVGQKPKFADFLTVVQQLRELHRGKYETTAELENRVAAARSGLPAKVVFKVHHGFSFDYDADAKSMSYNLKAFGKAESWLWTMADGALLLRNNGHERFGDGIDFAIRTVKTPQKPYVGTNAFGASRRISRSKQSMWLLHDETLETDAEFEVTEHSVSREKARSAETYETAFLVDVSDGVPFQITTDTDAPTLDKPSQETTSFTVLVAPISCAFVLDSGKVIRWFDLEEIRKASER